MPTTSSDLASLVTHLQNRTTDHLDGLDALLRRLRALARRLAPRDFAARGLLDDVVSRALELTCRRPQGHFDPERGSVDGYLSSMIRTAVRDVRDENQITVGRRRDYQDQPAVATGKVAKESTCELDSNIHLITELHQRLGNHPDLMIGALAIAFQADTVVDAAAAAGITRFQLTRKLARQLDHESLAA